MVSHSGYHPSGLNPVVSVEIWLPEPQSALVQSVPRWVDLCGVLGLFSPLSPQIYLAFYHVAR